MLLRLWRLVPQSEITDSSNLLLRDSKLTQAVIIGFAGGLFGHLVFGMMDAISLGAKPGIFYWMLLGLITGLYNINSNYEFEK